MVKLKLNNKLLNEFIWLIVLFIIGLFIYLYKITYITPGVWGDEVSFGFIAEKLYTIAPTPFVADNFGHPTLTFYLMGTVLKTFGRSIISLRLTSVIFGALSASLLYVTLRQLFNPKISIAASILFLTAYVQVTISRFAYELTMAIFFQILAILFFIFFYKKKKNKYLVGMAISLGLGLYTYLAFRSIAGFFVISIFIYIIVAKTTIETKLKQTIFFSLTLFIIGLPLIIYSINHPDHVLARTKSVSIFHQNYSSTEIKKELAGNVKKTLGMFINTPDPNPRHNPSRAIPFDWLTLILVLVGTYYFFSQKPRLLSLLLFLISASLLNDILSVERIPDFHYYGLGHPNTLRIAGLMPSLYLLAGGGFYLISQKLKTKNYIIGFLIISVILISFINLKNYFNQPYLAYNYQVNGVPALNIVKYINQHPNKNYYLSDSLYKDIRIQYFAEKYSKIKKFTLQKSDLSNLKSNSILIIDVQSNIDYLNKVIPNIDKTKYQIDYFVNPWNKIDAIIITNPGG